MATAVPFSEVSVAELGASTESMPTASMFTVKLDAGAWYWTNQ
jgi:hypothetical protein